MKTHFSSISSLSRPVLKRIFTLGHPNVHTVPPESLSGQFSEKDFPPAKKAKGWGEVTPLPPVSALGYIHILLDSIHGYSNKMYLLRTNPDG